MSKHHTGYTNSVNSKSNNKWVPSMWDRNGSQWTAIVRCGSWGPAIYGELCHQGACRPQGWAGSRRQLRKLLKERAGGTSRYNPSYKPFNRTIDAMVEARLLAIEQQGQYTVFKVLTPGATLEERYSKVAQGATLEERPATPEYQGATPEEQSATPEHHSLEGEKNRIKQKDRQEGGAGGNHPGQEPPFEAQHDPPVHTSECVSGAPTSARMTPAGEEPVPNPQADDACTDRHGETVGGLEPAPPSDSAPYHRDMPFRSPHSDPAECPMWYDWCWCDPPNKDLSLATESGPTLSDEEVDALAGRFREDLAKCSSFAELDEAIRKHLPHLSSQDAEQVWKRRASSEVPTEIESVDRALTDPPPPDDDDLCEYGYGLGEGSDKGLLERTSLPPPTDDDLPDYEDDLPVRWPDFDDEDEWQDFARKSWKRFLDRPIRFDLKTGEPSLVPRSEIPVALAAGIPTVDQALFGDTAPVTAEPFPALEDSEEISVGEVPETGEGSKGETHNHYESEGEDEPDGSVPDIGGDYDHYRADDSTVGGGENADDPDDNLPVGAPAGPQGDSGPGGGGEVSPGGDANAKAPEPAPEPLNREDAPEASPGQMSLLEPSESQESPPAERPKPATPREVTKALVAMYQETTGRVTRALPKRVSMIGARLAEGFSYEDLQQALLGWWHCRFYQEDQGCKGVRAAGFIWPFTSADKVEKCMQRFVDEAPVEAIESFTGRTGRRIPEREAELEQRRQAAEKLEREIEYYRQKIAEERRRKREGGLRVILPAIKQARRYEARLATLEGEEADVLRAYLTDTWERIRDKSDLSGVTRELEDKGLLPRDKGKEGGAQR